MLMSVVDPEHQAFGGEPISTYLFKYSRLSAKIFGYYKTQLPLVSQESDYFCWSNYAIFYKGMTTV